VALARTYEEIKAEADRIAARFWSEYGDEIKAILEKFDVAKKKLDEQHVTEIVEMRRRFAAEWSALVGEFNKLVVYLGLGG